MYIVEKFVVSLDIADPIDLYRYDARAELLRMLQNKFDGTCYKGVLILRVVDIARYGLCAMTMAFDAATARMPVEFVAHAVKYSPQDYIGGCVVMQKAEYVARLQSEYAYIGIPRTGSEGQSANALQTLAPGAVALCVTTAVEPIPASNKITICASVCAQPGANSFVVRARAHASVMAQAQLLGARRYLAPDDIGNASATQGRTLAEVAQEMSKLLKRDGMAPFITIFTPTQGSGRSEKFMRSVHDVVTDVTAHARANADWVIAIESHADLAKGLFTMMRADDAGAQELAGDAQTVPLEYALCEVLMRYITFAQAIVDMVAKKDALTQPYLTYVSSMRKRGAK